MLKLIKFITVLLLVNLVVGDTPVSDVETHKTSAPIIPVANTQTKTTNATIEQLQEISMAPKQTDGATSSEEKLSRRRKLPAFDDKTATDNNNKTNAAVEMTKNATQTGTGLKMVAENVFIKENTTTPENSVKQVPMNSTVNAAVTVPQLNTTIATASSAAPMTTNATTASVAPPTASTSTTLKPATSSTTSKTPNASSSSSTSTSTTTTTTTTSSTTTSTTTTTTPKPSSSTTKSTTTTTTTTTPKPKKPLITYGSEEQPDPVDGIPETEPVRESPVVQPSQEMAGDTEFHYSGRSRDYIVPFLTIMFAVPLAIGIVITAYRRFKDFWSTRHYRRMDFLVDGMYND